MPIQAGPKRSIGGPKFGGSSIHGSPAIYETHEFTTADGLINYGGSLAEAYRLIGVYAARILKGEMPGELPVQQVTKVELVLNLKIAIGDCQR